MGSKYVTIPFNMSAKYNAGESLKVWKEYRPYGSIYEADVDPKALIQDERVSTYKMDQTDSTSIKAVKDYFNKEFDLIVDVGLHAYKAVVSLFGNTFYKYLKKTPGTAYIIKNILISEYQDWLDYFENKSLKPSYITLPNKNHRFHLNNLILTKHIMTITEQNN